MYSTQPAHLATQRGSRGLPMILAAIIIVIIAALAVAVTATSVGASKSSVGDHSRDAGEGTRAGLSWAADHSLDQVENVRADFGKLSAPEVDNLRADFGKLSAPETVKAAPAVSSQHGLMLGKRPRHGGETSGAVSNTAKDVQGRTYFGQ